LYPEALEAYRNAAVDLILVSSRLNFDGKIVFEEVAQSRHMTLAVADSYYKGGIYKRASRPWTVNNDFINILKFDTQEGKIEPARGGIQIQFQGLQAIVK
jgi:hypothetical protein